jgi:predicted transcriptional regulator
MASAFRQMMREDRERLGLSVARASWLVGVSACRYRELEQGEEYPSYGEWSRMVDVFGWPRAWVAGFG